LRRGWKPHPFKASVQGELFSKRLAANGKELWAVLKGRGFQPRRKQSQIDSGFSRIRKKESKDEIN
jgi:hypothetical protein